MTTFQLNLTASSGQFYFGPCESLILPTKDGQYGVLAGHAPTLVGIRAGELRYRVDGQWQAVMVGDGFAEVRERDTTLLVDSVERFEEIDVNRAMEAKRRAEELMQHKRSMREYYEGKIALNRAMARLKVKNRH